MFIKYNNNPKNKKTGDCVIRAISFATKNSWENTYRALPEIPSKQSLKLNDTNISRKYLKILGYEQQKMPRKADNTRYTVHEFCNQLAKKNVTYIIKVANHITVVKDKDLYDTWDCSNKSVGNYWII